MRNSSGFFKLIFALIGYSAGLADGYSQPSDFRCYNLHFSLANYYYMVNEISMAKLHAECSLKFEKVHPKNDVLAAKVYLSIGDTAKAISSLNNALKKGVLYIDLIKQKPFKLLVGNKMLEQLKENSYRPSWTYEHLAFLEDVDSAIEADRILRRHYYDRNFFRTGSKVIVDSLALYHQDSLNHVTLAGLLKPDFPSYVSLGYQRQELLLNAVLHIISELKADSIQQYWINQMDKAVGLGDLQSLYYANHVDFLSYNDMQKEVYGTSMFQKTNDSLFSRPIIDVVNVDKRRFEIGLIPLQLHLNRWSNWYKKPIYPPIGYRFEETYWLDEMNAKCPCNK